MIQLTCDACTFVQAERLLTDWFNGVAFEDEDVNVPMSVRLGKSLPNILVEKLEAIEEAIRWVDELMIGGIECRKGKEWKGEETIEVRGKMN